MFWYRFCGRYQKTRESLRTIGRPIVYCLCQYGSFKVWKWGPKVGGNLCGNPTEAKHSGCRKTENPAGASVVLRQQSGLIPSLIQLACERSE